LKILDSKQMRNIDARATHEFGIPGILLMENAGAAAADAIEREYDDLERMRIAVLCGKGNNGGDGFVVARHLFNRGHEVLVVLLARHQDVEGDAQVNLRILTRIGVEIAVAADAAAWESVRADLARCDLAVDAILGTGLRGPVRGFLRQVIVELADLDLEVVSLDIPSGLSADTCQVPGEAVQADRTLAMGLPKIPHLLPPAELFCGELSILDISLPQAAIDAEHVALDLVEADAIRNLLPARSRTGHKGDFGHVLVVGGSRAMPGAAALAALGALRAGAGLVTVATGRGAQPLVHAHCAEAMVEPLPETEGGTLSRKGLAPLLKLASGKDVVVIGPGLGRATDVMEVVRRAVEKIASPMVIDADGLNALTGQLDRVRGSREHPRILTPHPGEMARLIGKRVDDVLRDRLAVARAFARKQQVYLVLKGYRSLVATPGGEVFVNPTGNPGMATAGTGDILSGMIAALVATARDPLDGILTAVYLHGLAGDLAATHRGEMGMIASDLLEHLPEATESLRRPGSAELPA
jgi:NAD(P)H-hydrate epimerase